MVVEKDRTDERDGLGRLVVELMLCYLIAEVELQRQIHEVERPCKG